MRTVEQIADEVGLRSDHMKGILRQWAEELINECVANTEIEWHNDEDPVVDIDKILAIKKQL